MSKFYIHNTGYFLTMEAIPSTTFPYILSTEATFCYLMLERYYKAFGAPFGKHNPSFNSDLMEYFKYYLPAESPVPINYLFYINHKNMKYSMIINQYEYLLE